MPNKRNIEQLLNDLRSASVEYKALGEIATRNKGMNITAGQMKEMADPDGDVRIFAAGNTKVDVLECDIAKANIIRVPGIIVKSRGHVSFEFYSKPFTHKNEMWSYSNFVGANIKYVFYYLEQHTQHFIDTAKANSVKLPQLCVADTDGYKIPLPPIELQNEIVRVLDTFAKLLDNIDTEIGIRLSQLEDARTTILSEIDGVDEWKTIGEICIYPNERIAATEIDEDNYVGVENMLQNKSGKTKASTLPTGNAIKFVEGDVLIGNIRPNLRKIWLADRIGGTNGDVVTLRRKDEYWYTIDTSYLYHVLADERFFMYDIQYARGAKMPRGNKEKILEYSIPVPPLAEQRAIAEKLDTIEAFINNLKTERDLRQQQYEYYREHLINLLK